jgi:Na+-translocating ferredoxin:NAD+ oxidoreductase RNF subunit RnfB
MTNKTISVLAVFILFLVMACTTDPILVQGDGTGVVTPPVEDLVPGTPCEGEVVSFKEKVLPIMISSCGYSGCHSRASQEDDVILVDYASVRNEVRPGDANNSDLYESLNEDPNDIMPPRPALELTNDQRIAIRDWINQGANDTDCAVPCEPDNIAYAANILPLIQDYCAGCHGDNREDGGVNLASHAEVLRYVEDGSLVGSMEHAVSFFPMPPEAVRVPECRILQVKNWIAAGAPNN